MSDIDFLFRGFIIGFSIAAPVGPIGVLCLRRTLVEGRVSGLITGLGAATADMIYGCIAALGLTFISNFLIDQRLWLRLIGGCFLCYLGFKTFYSKPAEQVDLTQGSGFAGVFASTFFFTITNPMTILSFMAIFAGFGVGETGGDHLSATALVLGVFLGSALWWFILSSFVSLFRRKFNAHRLLWVNRTSGIIITGFGIVALISLIV